MAKYYLAYGSNAVAVVQSWSRVNQLRKYFKAFNCKKFDSYEEADAAGLDHLSEIAPCYLPIPEHLVLDRVVSVSGLNKDYLASETTK